MLSQVILIPQRLELLQQKNRPNMERRQSREKMHNNALKDSESSPAAKQGVTGCNFCFVEHVEHTKAAY